MTIPVTQKPHLVAMLAPTPNGYDFESWFAERKLKMPIIYKQSILADPGSPKTHQHHWLTFVLTNKRDALLLHKNLYNALYVYLETTQPRTHRSRLDSQIKPIPYYNVEALNKKLPNLDVEALKVELAFTFEPDFVTIVGPSGQKSPTLQFTETFLRYIRTAPKNVIPIGAM